MQLVSIKLDVCLVDVTFGTYSEMGEVKKVVKKEYISMLFLNCLANLLRIL